MTYIPEDPVEVLIQRFKNYSRIVALILMDEYTKIGDGMSKPNQIVFLPLDFERQNEDVISSRVEQYRSPLLLACTVTTRFLLKKYRRNLSAIRLASNR